MIDETHKSASREGIRESRKLYFLLTRDGSPLAICTNIMMARTCIKEMMKDMKCQKMEGRELYVGTDKDGEHLYSIIKLHRWKVGNSTADDED